MAARLPTDVIEARLNHLIDRARRNRLLTEEADRFTAHLRDLVRRLEDEEDSSRRLLTQRQEMAAERYAWQERGDQAEARVRALTAEVSRLTAGQCTHTRAMCEQHHAVPVAGCPYSRCLAATATGRAATA
ncbi:hypothetical protein J7F02_28340 [Streptomyces sp. ISL-112]|uniref:hypothetical protein n=1 Tax=unclassified Streptomyces TaxID=2593676 RepID=UPI001BEB1A63|nr:MULTISPECIES: hypothetical protein [unclassified Streptomyces]MBT2429420.1 hypothetical protein [Streptomyces sp. ISL-112]MBT2464012.1 hypothetical protein [Streptomyces sp. ISL-63]